ncbi:MAG: hybrid sensor histidine kinase/response regulator [Rickettsiales bacterium]|nr:hybrid sensor histidine kinase/response regulator [Rickettsiales bacterium]
MKDKIKQRLSFNVSEARPYYTIFGSILIIAYVGFYFFNIAFVAPTGYENFPLRLAVGVFGFLFIIRDYWPKILIKYETFIFYISLLYSLPFFFIYMLLQNQSLSIWYINGLVGLTILTFFVDWISYVILVFLGSFFAYLATLYGNPEFEISSLFWRMTSSYSAPVIYFIIFAHKRESMYKQKIDYIEQITHLSNSLEQKVIQRTSELQKALDIKTEFLNNLNHEIRTPIQGFTNISEGLLTHWDTFNNKKKLNLVQKIVTNATRLSSLVGTLLDISKFTDGKMIFDFHTHNMNQIIEDIIEECRMLYILDKNIKIKFIKNKHPNAEIDKERIAQVLRNLFTNAIKFSHKNTTITATIHRAEKNLNNTIQEVLTFTITDQGIGIPEEELVSIFKPFNQSKRTKTKAGGTGLGLSICNQIIKGHGGKIWAENTTDDTKFHFTIPVTQHYKSQLKHSTTTDKSNTQSTVLMIDDEETCLISMEFILMKTKYKLIKAHGGIEGLAFLKKHSHDINAILLDMMMPDIYGLDVLKEIKNDPTLANIPVILQTGISNDLEINKAYDLGIVAYIKKPYQKDLVLDVLSKL